MELLETGRREGIQLRLQKAHAEPLAQVAQKGPGSVEVWKTELLGWGERGALAQGRGRGITGESGMRERLEAAMRPVWHSAFRDKRKPRVLAMWLAYQMCNSPHSVGCIQTSRRSDACNMLLASRHILSFSIPV